VTDDWRLYADDWWSDVLRVPRHAIRDGGVHATHHLDHVGVISVREAVAPLVYGPPELLPLLHAKWSNAATLPMLARSLSDGLGSRARRVLGPAWYGYTDATSVAVSDIDSVRALEERDLAALDALHQQTPTAEREESGTTGLPAFGIFGDDRQLLAVACLGVWNDMPTIGVLTHPSARGQGLARRVVAAAAQQGLRHRTVVQYRARVRNTTSISVAQRSGFRHYCDGLVIDLV